MSGLAGVMGVDGAGAGTLVEQDAYARSNSMLRALVLEARARLRASTPSMDRTEEGARADNRPEEPEQQFDDPPNYDSSPPPLVPGDDDTPSSPSPPSNQRTLRRNLSSPQPAPRTSETDQAEERDDKWFSVFVIVFMGNRMDGTVYGRAMIPSAYAHEDSADVLIPRIFGHKPDDEPHSLSRFSGSQFSGYAVATSRVPSSERYGSDAFTEQPGHKVLGILDQFLLDEPAHSEETLEEMDQLAERSRELKEQLPAHVDPRHYDGRVFIIYLVALADGSRRLEGTLPSNVPRTPSPSITHRRPSNDPDIRSSSVSSSPRSNTSYAPPTLGPPDGRAVTPYPRAGQQMDAVPSSPSARRSRRGTAREPRRPRRRNGQIVADTAGNPAFDHISAYLSDLFPGTSALLSFSGGNAEHGSAATSSIRWFVRRTQLFIEVATYLGMPFALENDVYHAPQPIGWDGMIRADDLVAWFSSHDRGGGVSRRTLGIHRGKVQSLTTFWAAHQDWYYERANTWDHPDYAFGVGRSKLEVLGIVGYCLARTDVERSNVCRGTPPGVIPTLAGSTRPKALENNLKRLFPAYRRLSLE